MRRAHLELTHELGPGVAITDDSVASSPGIGLLILEYSKLIVRQIAFWLGRA
jgi:hypothetical protein